MNRMVALFLSIAFIIYPLLVYFGLTRFSPKVVGGILLTVLFLRVLFLARSNLGQLKQFLPIFIAALPLALFSIIFNNSISLMLLPVLANFSFFVTFFHTFWKKPTMIERFAAIGEEKITPEISRYCYKVNVIWCIFFVFNGSVAFYTVFFTSKEYWMLYNGLISYIFIGLLGGGELILRKITKAKNEKTSKAD